jgi:hypothetical protein
MGFSLKKREAKDVKEENGGKKPLGERVENIRKKWNGFRRFLNVDTAKSRW